MKIIRPFQHDAIQGFKFGSWPFGKPRFLVHVFFVDGLLIDTGHSNMRREIVEQIGAWPVEQIFLTHHHEDHTGNLGPLQERFQCPSYASSTCVELMKAPPPISLAQWLSWGKTTPNFNIQVEDKSITTPSYHFQAIHIPGHAPDMVGLYEAQQGWFFSADLFVSDYIKFFMPTESMAEQIKSIRKVLQLDFDVLLCNHNPTLTGGKRRLERKLAFLENFYGEVSRLYHQGYSVSNILREMKLREDWFLRLLSGGALSTANMIRSVIRDETLHTS